VLGPRDIAPTPSGKIIVNPGERELQVDRVIALPQLSGPALSGVPATEHGFLRTSPNCELLQLERVYAAGDCVDFPVKHGGLASQMADAAAESIAALAGAPVDPHPFEPEIMGMLLTGGKPLYLHAKITGGHGFSSEASEEPLWSPPSKIASKYLAPFLDAQQRSAGAAGSP
jgi:sulfide:quinone oxidoreductase